MKSRLPKAPSASQVSSERGSTLNASASSGDAFADGSAFASSMRSRTTRKVSSGSRRVIGSRTMMPVATLPVAALSVHSPGLRRLIGTRVISSVTPRRRWVRCQLPMPRAMIVQMTSIIVPPSAALSARISAKGSARPLRRRARPAASLSGE